MTKRTKLDCECGKILGFCVTCCMHEPIRGRSSFRFVYIIVLVFVWCTDFLACLVGRRGSWSTMEGLKRFRRAKTQPRTISFIYIFILFLVFLILTPLYAIWQKHNHSYSWLICVIQLFLMIASLQYCGQHRVCLSTTEMKKKNIRIADKKLHRYRSGVYYRDFQTNQNDLYVKIPITYSSTILPFIISNQPQHCTQKFPLLRKLTKKSEI